MAEGEPSPSPAAGAAAGIDDHAGFGWQQAADIFARQPVIGATIARLFEERVIARRHRIIEGGGIGPAGRPGAHSDTAISARHTSSTSSMVIVSDTGSTRIRSAIFSVTVRSPL